MQCTWSKSFTAAKEYLFHIVQFMRSCLNWAMQVMRSLSRSVENLGYVMSGRILFRWCILIGIENSKYLCAVLDDASRKILEAGEFGNETTANAIVVLKKAYDECKPLYPILSIVTDHGSQFYANKRDVEGYAEHGFEGFLEEVGIKHILCGVNHPQTNGKLEKWHDCYIHHRGRYGSLEEFVLWYNNRPHGALNLRRAETPNEAFIRKMRPEVWLGLGAKLFGW